MRRTQLVKWQRWYFCDRKAQVAKAQSFTLWQQARIEIIPSPAIYGAPPFTGHPLNLNQKPQLEISTQNLILKPQPKTSTQNLNTKPKPKTYTQKLDPKTKP